MRPGTAVCKRPQSPSPRCRRYPRQETLPGTSTDDGLYEDINGNGVLDFNDVVLYFNQMDWIADNEPVGAFDFNRNGRIDFNDIVVLFTTL